MMEQRNLVIAIVLSVLIVFGFQYVLQPRLTHAPTAQRTAPAQPAHTVPGTVPPLVATEAEAARTRAGALAEAPRVRIETPTLHGSINLRGARFDDLTLAKYRETVDPKSPEIQLLSPIGTAAPYLADFGWVAAAGSTAKLPDGTTRWTASGETLTPQSPLTLTWDNGAGLRFTRVVSVDDNYMFTVTQTVENTGTAAVALYPYSSITRLGTPPTSSYYLLFMGMLGDFNGVLKEVKYASLKDGAPLDVSSTGGWLGFTDKFWLTALVPAQDKSVTAHFSLSVIEGTNHYQTDFLNDQQTIQPGGRATEATRFFAGPKVVKLLDMYQDQLGIRQFDYAVDWGWFWFLTKPIFYALDWLYGLIGNFGVAILVFTVFVKLLFFPLANKSYAAMSRMKLLQPEIAKLREKFGDDKARLNEETMALYKRVGANPLAGCLPMIVQIPVFFSLYKDLYVTIEMRHAPFFGWIHDLSAPDPTSFANLFGLLPWHPPAVLLIGAWPIVMGFTMLLQQKLTPQADPTQARMMMVLPVVFTYMLAAFPAGLVIYWAWNNTLSVLQQWVIMRRASAAAGRAR